MCLIRTAAFKIKEMTYVYCTASCECECVCGCMYVCLDVVRGWRIDNKLQTDKEMEMLSLFYTKISEHLEEIQGALQVFASSMV